MEEKKKEGEVRAMKTEGKKLTWSSKRMRRQKKRGHWDMEYQRQKRIQGADASSSCNSFIV